MFIIFFINLKISYNTIRAINYYQFIKFYILVFTADIVGGE